ncbi:hypothetical protein Pden_1584 [Paracoccus denitrificans PD1222]|uniref:Uncharacterized protein n=1 Tax=Paracoccus denitrificans (strain Pd 1222) TaxID=318586 RepID=A1B2E0_PARDP|nr:hypothetical protein Pden_1584 [Paracoccus denitrificans PD1222]
MIEKLRRNGPRRLESPRGPIRLQPALAVDFPHDLPLRVQFDRDGLALGVHRLRHDARAVLQDLADTAVAGRGQRHAHLAPVESRRRQRTLALRRIRGGSLGRGASGRRRALLATAVPARAVVPAAMAVALVVAAVMVALVPAVVLALAMPFTVAPRIAPAKAQQGAVLGKGGAQLVSVGILPGQHHPALAREHRLQRAQLAKDRAVAHGLRHQLVDKRLRQRRIAPGTQAAQLALGVQHGVDLRAVGQLALDPGRAARTALAGHIAQPRILQCLGQHDRRRGLGRGRRGGGRVLRKHRGPQHRQQCRKRDRGREFSAHLWFLPYRGVFCGPGRIG